MTGQLPEDAVSLAADALHGCWPQEIGREEVRAVAREVVQAAAPAIRAEERERIAKLVEGYECPCNEDIARWIRE